MEKWKTIPGLQNYEVSNLGNVRNAKTKRLKVQSVINGYMRVVIKKTYLVHRLVASAFLENNGFQIVHHKDNNKQNNAVSNLEWTTQSYNIKKAYQDGLVSDRTGKNNPNYRHGKYVK